MDLFYDYRSNVPLYPQFQAFFRKYQPPTLIVWGKNDFIFPAEGAARTGLICRTWRRIYSTRVILPSRRTGKRSPVGSKSSCRSRKWRDDLARRHSNRRSSKEADL